MEENKYEDFQLSSTENRIPANTQVDELNGKKITADDFKLVQQDKSIHDLKFTTKPTTFFKDARHRFVKNRSSVVGGVILGVLFVLSLILPINGVVPFDISSKHNYETNLPPKIAAASNGFWDGTRWHKNEAYPYDKDGNYIGQYASDDYIVKIDNVREGYGDGHADDANGGFVRLVGDKKDKEEIRYRYSYAYTYDLNNTYTLSYTLGQSTDQEGVRPDYSLLFFTNNQFVALDRTSVYPAIAEKATAEGQKISTYETVTLDITDALKKNEKISALLGSGKTIKGSLGIRFYTKNTSSTALYLKNFDLSSSSSSKIEKRELTAPSMMPMQGLVSLRRSMARITRAIGPRRQIPLLLLAMLSPNAVMSFMMNTRLPMDLRRIGRLQGLLGKTGKKKAISPLMRKIRPKDSLLRKKDPSGTMSMSFPLILLPLRPSKVSLPSL